MAEKQKKKAKARGDLEYEKAKEKSKKKFNTDMGKLSKSNFEDFRKGVIKKLRDIHEFTDQLYKCILDTIDWYARDRDKMAKDILIHLNKNIKHIDKQIDNADENFNILRTELTSLQQVTFLQAVLDFKARHGGINGEEMKKLGKLFYINPSYLIKEAPETEPAKDLPGA